MYHLVFKGYIFNSHYRFPPLNIQPIVVVRGLKRQQAAAFLLSCISFSFLFAEWPYWSQRWAHGPNNVFHSILSFSKTLSFHTLNDQQLLFRCTSDPIEVKVNHFRQDDDPPYIHKFTCDSEDCIWLLLCVSGPSEGAFDPKWGEGGLIYSKMFKVCLFADWRTYTHCWGLTPKRRGNFIPHSRAIFSKLKNENKDLFSFRNCKKWCKKAENAIISLSFPSYVNWQPPENRLCIGKRARLEVAWRGFGSPQAVVYEWIWLSIVLPYADHLFSMIQTLLPRFCSNEAREMVMCL